MRHVGDGMCQPTMWVDVSTVSPLLTLPRDVVSGQDASVAMSWAIAPSLARP
jgi:hypothetical protein